MKKAILFHLILFGGLISHGQLRLANIFSDHMVLQRDAPVNIWGWAAPDAKLSIQFHQQLKHIKAGNDGKWLATLDKETAGGPYALTVKTNKETIVINDVLMGDVWICSGQSNMEWTLNASANAQQAITAANNRMIRHVKVERKVSAGELDDISKANWQVCTPATAGEFTAVGYYFAQHLQAELNVPIGLINSSWGGTMVETWISKTGLQSNAEFINVANQLPSSKEQFEKEQLERLQKDISAFQQSSANENVDGWEKYDFDDHSWSSLEVPKSWEDQGLPTFDGIVWYRRDFMLTKEQAADDIVLHLGMIDDCDDTYVNGIKAGNNCTWDAQRNYVVPKSLLKEGRNVIAVKVTDGGGGGGFHGDAANVKMEAGKDVVSLAGKWKARVDVKSSLISINPNSMPALLYNAMIHPLLKYAVKGVTWYQGESNASRSYQYNTSFSLLINDWRNKFNQPAMPFYFVQLASFNDKNQNGTDGSRWAELREAQLHTAALPHTGMAVTTDIGDPKDIHPRNKKDVGYRLALQVLKNEYGKNNIVSSGPVYKSMSVEKNSIRLKFDNTGAGLAASGNKYGYLTGFMIAGNDQKFHWAKASIENNEVIVWSDEVSEPVAVRYGWTDDASEANLFNKEGLPASPFRTDNWKLLTQDTKYKIGQ